MYLQRGRAADLGRAADTSLAAVGGDAVLGLPVRDPDVHRQVRAIDHGHVVEVEVLVGVHVVLSQRRRDLAPAAALIQPAAVAGLAMAAAVLEATTRPAPRARIAESNRSCPRPSPATRRARWSRGCG